MHPSNEQWLAFYNAFKRRTGLDLNYYKQDQLRRRILSMMESRGCKTLDEFWTKLASSDKDLRWFQDKLAINVSELFRNPEKWVELRERVLPDLLSRSRTLKCWSAGCSYGAEAYSLAITLDRWFLRILAVEAVILVVFTHWYAFRYLGIGFNLGIRNTLALAIGLSLLVVVGDWIWARVQVWNRGKEKQ